MFVMIISLTACVLQRQITITKPVTIQAQESCIDSFDNFAFSTPDIDGSEQEKILPGNQWVIEALLPEEARNERYKIAATRSFNNTVQIWLQPVEQVGVYEESGENKRNYLIYDTGLKRWINVPASIEKTNIFVDRIFIGSDGKVWGRNVWNYPANIAEIPALSRFNEINHRFEFESITSQIPNGLFDSKDKSHTPIPNWNEVLLDANNVFWIFAHQDAIYSYDPDNQSVIRHVSLEEFSVVRDLALAPDGTIYFRNLDIRTEGVYLKKGQIYQYFPRSEEIKAIQLPKERWPAANSILVDKSGRLWLGVFGWKNPNGEWNAFHPQMDAFIQLNKYLPLWKYYQPPTLIMESSDGKLWFAIPRSEEWKTLRSGIAWYDPRTNEGCWCTTEGDNVDEDITRTVWLTAGDNLYRYLFRR